MNDHTQVPLHQGDKEPEAPPELALNKAPCLRTEMPSLYTWFIRFDEWVVRNYRLEKYGMSPYVLSAQAIQMLNSIGKERKITWKAHSPQDVQLWVLACYSLCLKYSMDHPLKEWMRTIGHVIREHYTVKEFMVCEWDIFQAVRFRLR